MPVPKKRHGPPSAPLVAAAAPASMNVVQFKKTDTLQNQVSSTQWSVDTEGELTGEAMELGGEKAMESARTLLSIGFEIKPCWEAPGNKRWFIDLSFRRSCSCIYMNYWVGRFDFSFSFLILVCFSSFLFFSLPPNKKKKKKNFCFSLSVNSCVYWYCTHVWNRVNSSLTI